MFNRFRKKKHPQESTPINPNIEGVLHNAMRIHRAHQAATIDPAATQDQTQANLIADAPYSTSAPVQVSSPSTSTSTANHIDQLQVISGQAADLPQRVGGRSWISSSVSIGQDQAFNEVCRFLTEKDVAIVGIYGMGGVGKTTLMKKVRKEFLEPSNFKVLSTVVSRTENIDKIQEDLMRDMDLPFERDANRYKRARDISKAITNCSRKVAVLFDDIWEVLDLDGIGNFGAIDLNTSIFKVIFTTRLEDVCSQMQPNGEIKIQPLGWDDSWALFAKNVGTKTLHSNNEIIDLAKSVAKECGGLPLAVVVIGRAMTCQYSLRAWVNALFTLQTSPSKILRSEEKLFSILKFSYDNIQNDVEKECFLFCCLYPEDWKIDRHELVEFWIGSGILDLDGSYYDTCNRGYAIVDRLLAACLLELKDDKLTMHDIVYDMGLWIASELRFFVHDRRSKFTEDRLMSLWKEAHGIYVLENDKLPQQPCCQNLSTLIIENKMVSRILMLPSSLFQFMDKLRILKLIGSVKFIDASHVILGQLVELRHLSLLGTEIRKFPTDFGNLRKLNVLEIHIEGGTEMLLPPAIGQLTELRRLVITGLARTGVMLPVEYGMLSKLEELSIRLIVDNFMNQIPDGIFKGMGELRKLELRVTSMRKLPADLWNLSKLEYLRIRANWSNTVPSWLKAEDIAGLKRLSKSLKVVEMRRWPIFKWDDIRSALEAMNLMSELTIDGCPLDEIVITSKSTCFYKLKKLHIDQCPQLEKLEVGGDALNGLSYLSITECASLRNINDLEHLQCLKYLKIEYCLKLEGELIKPNEGIGSSPIICFPCLEIISLLFLPQVTIICSDNVSFPCLSQLYVLECCKLEKFPRGLMNEKRPLRGKIVGKMEWWEGVQWQDEDFKSYLFPLFWPN